MNDSINTSAHASTLAVDLAKDIFELAFADAAEKSFNINTLNANYFSIGSTITHHCIS